MSLLNELKRNLANAEEVGDVEWARRLTKRISQVEKELTPAPAEKPASETKTAAEKTVKKG